MSEGGPAQVGRPGRRGEPAGLSRRDKPGGSRQPAHRRLTDHSSTSWAVGRRPSSPVAPGGPRRYAGSVVISGGPPEVIGLEPFSAGGGFMSRVDGGNESAGREARRAAAVEAPRGGVDVA